MICFRKPQLSLPLGFLLLYTLATRPAHATTLPAPTNVMARWAGTDPSGRPVSVVLSWNAVPGAVRYNIYRAARVVPQEAGQTALFRRNEPTTSFIDPSASMGVDVVYFYQVTAVNSAGESPKSSVAVPGFPVADIPVVIQGTLVAVSGHTLTVKTPDRGPDCAPGMACPQYIILGPTFLVDATHALFEDAAGTPITAQKLAVGDAVIIAARRAPAPDAATNAPIPALPVLVAQVIELTTPRVMPPALNSGITGTARVGPISPVEHPGQANDKPLAGAIITIQPAGGGAEIRRATADSSGNFRISLPPGTYLLVPLPPQPGATLPRGTAQTVTVVANQLLKVVVEYDSGIR